jgi:hypothetical protein
LDLLTTTERKTSPRLDGYPYLLLRADNWDDFGYKTTYALELHQSRSDSIRIGMVKIMRLGLEQSLTPIPLPPVITGLPEEYCSLGQKLSYYESLQALLSERDRRDYLAKMQDIVLATEQRKKIFEVHNAYETSLLREGGARRALADAPDLLRGTRLDSKLQFEFTTSVGGTQFTSEFVFGDSEAIPSRLNAVIGYNGAGKTQLMANLSHVAWRDAQGRVLDAQRGVLTPPDIAFGRVVAISYSAFDTFDLPSATEQYYYCGLRDTADPESHRLKNVQEIATELEGALDRLRATERWEALSNALAPLLREPSFQTAGLTLDFRDSGWRLVFDRLSTGHKISLNIVVQLVAQLENKSLVLIDEPECHLHPPLLAALMKGVMEALSETNSFAIIATHSPVVLQEVAARHVQVIRRYGLRTTIERPLQETFGENLGILTRSVFNLDNTESDYEGVLRDLAISHGVDRLNTVFPDGLSAQAMAIVQEAVADLEEEEEEEDV